MDLPLEIKDFPNQGIIWSILNGGKNGKCIELAKNAWIILENIFDPFVFLAGTITKDVVEVVLSLVADRTFPMIYCHPIYHPLFLERGWDYHMRIELTLNDFKKTPLQENLVVKRIDQLDLFKKCFWYKEISELYGSPETFINSGVVGYALCLDDQVLSETYAMIGNGYAEIGVVTHVEHRHKGYASQIVTALIEECQQLGITPMWSCNMNNRASLHTALGLGFLPSGYHAFMVPPAKEKQ